MRLPSEPLQLWHTLQEAHAQLSIIKSCGISTVECRFVNTRKCNKFLHIN